MGKLARLTSLSVFMLLIMRVAAGAATILTENFDDITTLTGAGWVQTNQSSPLGTSGWFQGVPLVFSSQAGATDAYIAANFQNGAGVSTISNWLLTPVLSLNNGDALSFYTRTVLSPSSFPDRLEVRLSTSGASSDVGVGATGVGDFSTLLLSVNAGLTTTGYPDDWTQFTEALSGLGGPQTGRLAFRYFVTDGGPAGANSDYIGIDTVRYDTTTTAVPEPASFALVALGLAGLAVRRLRGARESGRA